MRVPDWWHFLLLALAAWRVYRLIAEDTILDGPRARLLRYRGWDGKGPAPKGYREKWGEFITCPFCCGAWCCFAILAVYCILFGWIGFFSFFVVWFAMSAVVALVAKNLDKDE